MTIKIAREAAAALAFFVLSSILGLFGVSETVQGS